MIVCQCEECPKYRQADAPLKVIDETYGHWIFRCQTCLNLRTVDKHRAGGTIGAGRREDQPPKTLW